MFGAILGGLAKAFTASSVATGFKSLGGAVAGGMVNRFFDNTKQSDSYNYLASKGLTPQEIAASGAAGQGSSGVGNVLGNTAAQLESQKREFEYQEEQRALDRAVAVRGQDVSASNAAMSVAPQMAMLPYNQQLSTLQQQLTAMQTMTGIDANARQHLGSARNVLEALLASPAGSPERAMYANQLKAIGLENAGNFLGDALRMFRAPGLGRGRGASPASPRLGSSPAPSGGRSPSVNRRGLTPSQRIESKNYGHVIE